MFESTRAGTVIVDAGRRMAAGAAAAATRMCPADGHVRLRTNHPQKQHPATTPDDAAFIGRPRIADRRCAGGRRQPAARRGTAAEKLAPGVTPDQATAEFTAFARRLAAEYPTSNKQFNTGQVQKLIESFTPRPLRGTLLTMLGFCIGVLLIACVNVMNMQFARATQRAKELAVRSSLGATRARLMRQMLTESLLVAGIGAVAGIGLAYNATGWLYATVRSMDNPPPAYIVFDVDGWVLAFTVAATLFGVTGRDPLIYLAVSAVVVIVSVIATLVPARRATRVDPMIAVRAE
jgi:ABC-type antimicrobial peptide transport system permease subunit